jgi:hypothetical protein
MLAFAGTDDLARTHWLTVLRARTDQTMAVPAGAWGVIRLNCTAPSEAAAETMLNQVNDYFYVAPTAHLIPPWRPDEARDSAQIARDELARRTFAKLRALGNNVYAQPGLLDIQKREIQARSDGDEPAVQRAIADRKQFLADARRKELEQLENDTSGQVDQEMIRLYLQDHAATTRAAATQSSTAIEMGFDEFLYSLKDSGPMAARMGQLALTGGKPMAADDIYSVHGGFCHRTGKLLRFDYLAFTDVYDGPAALARWLQIQGCSQFKYDFSPPRNMGGNEDDSGDDGP